jgi:hypothetical protein
MNEPFATHAGSTALPPRGEKFIDAARAPGCDDNPERFGERAGKPE